MADETKISQLTERFTAVTEDEYFLISEYTGVPTIYESKKIKKTILLGFTEYASRLEQQVTNNPTQNVLCGDLGVVSYLRLGVGTYRCTGTGLFSVGKTFIVFGNVFNDAGINNGSVQINGTTLTSDEFEFTTYNDGVVSDNVLLDTAISIKVYL